MARILVIEGNSGVRDVLRERLFEQCQDTILAISSADCQSGLDLYFFDVVICNINSGLEFIKRYSGSQLIQRFILTGGAVEEEVQGIVRQTGRPILPKPIDFGNLRQEIDKVLTSF